MWRIALGLAYLSSTLIVSPCLAAQRGSRAKKRELTLAQFVEKLRREGRETQFAPILVRLTGFPEGSTTRGLQAPVAEATDGRSRTAEVVFSKGAGDSPAPVGLLWITTLRTEGKSEAYDYHTSLDGKLKRVVRFDGKLDQNGKVVRGGTVPTELDIDSQDVRARFQREVLDFWLKGVGRTRGQAARPQ